MSFAVLIKIAIIITMEDINNMSREELINTVHKLREENERLILNPNYQSYEIYKQEKELNNKILSKVEKILDLVPNRRLVHYFNKKMKIKKNFVTGKISGVKE